MDAMVTARMPQGKKEAGNTILYELGTNPSQFINDIYDYVITTRTLPFKNEPETIKAVDIKKALDFIESIPLPAPSRFATMTADEIRQERLIARGLATEADFK